MVWLNECKLHPTSTTPVTSSNVPITLVDSSDVSTLVTSLTLSATPVTSSNLPITLVDNSNAVRMSVDDPGPLVVSL